MFIAYGLGGAPWERRTRRRRARRLSRAPHGAHARPQITAKDILLLRSKETGGNWNNTPAAKLFPRGIFYRIRC
jgi:hypothetical protein